MRLLDLLGTLWRTGSRWRHLAGSLAAGVQHVVGIADRIADEHHLRRILVRRAKAAEEPAGHFAARPALTVTIDRSGSFVAGPSAVGERLSAFGFHLGGKRRAGYRLVTKTHLRREPAESRSVMESF